MSNKFKSWLKTPLTPLGLIALLFGAFGVYLAVKNDLFCASGNQGRWFCEWYDGQAKPGYGDVEEAPAR